MKYEIVLEKLDGTANPRKRKFKVSGNSLTEAMRKVGEKVAEDYENYWVDFWSLFDARDLDQSVDDFAEENNLTEIANCVYCKVVSTQLIA